MSDNGVGVYHGKLRWPDDGDKKQSNFSIILPNKPALSRSIHLCWTAENSNERQSSGQHVIGEIRSIDADESGKKIRFHSTNHDQQHIFEAKLDSSDKLTTLSVVERGKVTELWPNKYESIVTNDVNGSVFYCCIDDSGSYSDAKNKIFAGLGLVFAIVGCMTVDVPVLLGAAVAEASLILAGGALYDVLTSNAPVDGVLGYNNSLYRNESSNNLTIVLVELDKGILTVKTAVKDRLAEGETKLSQVIADKEVEWKTYLKLSLGKDAAEKKMVARTVAIISKLVLDKSGGTSLENGENLIHYDAGTIFNVSTREKNCKLFSEPDELTLRLSDEHFVGFVAAAGAASAYDAGVVDLRCYPPRRVWQMIHYAVDCNLYDRNTIGDPGVDLPEAYDLIRERLENPDNRYRAYSYVNPDKQLYGYTTFIKTKKYERKEGEEVKLSYVFFPIHQLMTYQHIQ